ncbi:uncharacterized protein EI90DRAFT_2631072 [Cantharellus anzutake]|uniref:uncharacterized protein n=1 Tax=Cantharellus anzutake TaxID=1750568 RepID=UPI0019081C97|nr:uncharacterized protein EI90DRAFT_2631072 [Cantharellus anzutake]KAF8319568.1 hypothetical protein EI90DRAFT_2631072 [Cantharellus anzutake]
MTTNNTTLPTIAGTMDKSPIPTVVVPRTPPSYHVTSAATRNSTGTTPPMAEDSSSLIATPSTNNPPIGRHPSPLTPPLTPAHALSSSSKLIEEVDESVGFVESNIIGNDAHSTPPASAGKDKPTYVGGQQSRYVPLTPVTPKQGNPSSSSFDSPHSSGTNSLVEPVSISSSPYGLSSDEVVGSTPNGGLDTGIGLGGVSVVGVEGNLDAPQSPGRFLFLYVGPGPVGAGASTVGSECEKGSGGSEATIGSWDVEKMKEEFGEKFLVTDAVLDRSR